MFEGAAFWPVERGPRSTGIGRVRSSLIGESTSRPIRGPERPDRDPYDRAV